MFGIGIMPTFVVCVRWIRRQFGLETSGALVLETSVILLLVSRCATK